MAWLMEMSAGLRSLAGDPRLDPTLRPRVCLLTLQMAEWLGRGELRVQAAEQALQAAEQWGGWAEVGLVRLEAGRALCEAEADRRAAEVLQLFLDHLDRYPWLGVERGAVQCRLGLVLQRSRQYAAALHAYRRAVESLGGNPEQQLAAYHHCVWLALRLGRYREAARYLAWSAPLAEDSRAGALTQKALQALYFHRTGDRESGGRLAAEVHAAAAAAGAGRALALATHVLAQHAGSAGRTAEEAARRAELQAQLEYCGDAELRAWLRPQAPRTGAGGRGTPGVGGSSDAATWSQ